MKNNYRLESRMRENRPCGSEGGEGSTLPDPYRKDASACPSPPPSPLGSPDASAAAIRRGEGADRAGVTISGSFVTQ